MLALTEETHEHGFADGDNLAREIALGTGME